MGKGITVGLDIAKHVFQIHGVGVQGTVVVRRKLIPSQSGQVSRLSSTVL